MPEYDRERFESMPDPELVCPICHCVLDNPQETLCRHVFCKTCIETWIKSQTGVGGVANRCPTCRKYLHISDIKPALPLLCNLISRLRVKCINYSNGCQVIVAKEMVTQHEKHCGYESSKCRNLGCGKPYLKKDKEKHEEECEMKLVICSKDCELMITRRDVKDHNCLNELKKRLNDKDAELRRSQDMINDILSGQVRSMANAVRQNTLRRPNMATEIFANVRNHIQSYARTIAHDRESTARFASSLMSSLQADQQDPNSPDLVNADSFLTPNREYSPASTYSPGYNPTPEYSPFSPNHSPPNDTHRAEYRPTPIPRYSPYSPPRRVFPTLTRGWHPPTEPAVHRGSGANLRAERYSPGPMDGFRPMFSWLDIDEHRLSEEDQDSAQGYSEQASYQDLSDRSSQSSQSTPESNRYDDDSEIINTDRDASDGEATDHVSSSNEHSIHDLDDNHSDDYHSATDRSESDRDRSDPDTSDPDDGDDPDDDDDHDDDYDPDDDDDDHNDDDHHADLESQHTSSESLDEAEDQHRDSDNSSSSSSTNSSVRDTQHHDTNSSDASDSWHSISSNQSDTSNSVSSPDRDQDTQDSIQSISDGPDQHNGSNHSDYRSDSSWTSVDHAADRSSRYSATSSSDSDSGEGEHREKPVLFISDSSVDEPASSLSLNSDNESRRSEISRSDDHEESDQEGRRTQRDTPRSPDYSSSSDSNRSSKSHSEDSSRRRSTSHDPHPQSPSSASPQSPSSASDSENSDSDLCRGKTRGEERRRTSSEHTNHSCDEVDLDKMSEGSFEPDYTEPESDGAIDTSMDMHGSGADGEEDVNRDRRGRDSPPSGSDSSHTSSRRKNRGIKRENDSGNSSSDSARSSRRAWSPQPGSSHWTRDRDNGSSSESDSSSADSFRGRKRKHKSSKSDSQYKRRKRY